VESATLANYLDYTQSFDIFYVYTSKLDLVGGYRIRVSQTSIGNDTVDHWFNVGATGGLFAKLNGTVRLGYQIRDISHAQTFTHINALAATRLARYTQAQPDWHAHPRFQHHCHRRLGRLPPPQALRANYAINRQFEILAGVSYGRNQLPGHSPTSPPRHLFQLGCWPPLQTERALPSRCHLHLLSQLVDVRLSLISPATAFAFDIASRF
jgi:hypothetical protein